jgi:hypothetical protein
VVKERLDKARVLELTKLEETVVLALRTLGQHMEAVVAAA